MGDGHLPLARCEGASQGARRIALNNDEVALAKRRLCSACDVTDVGVGIGPAGAAKVQAFESSKAVVAKVERRVLSGQQNAWGDAARRQRRRNGRQLYGFGSGTNDDACSRAAQPSP